MIITKVEPFYAFLNEEGLARFCVEEYELPETGNYENSGIHLTNYSQSKGKDGYIYTEELTEINEGTKRTLESYWKSVEKDGLKPSVV